MGKKFRRSGRALIIWTSLMAVVCVPSFIAGAAYTRAENSETPVSGIVKKPLQNETEPSAEWQTVRMQVTAYCPCPECCGQYSDVVTAAGRLYMSTVNGELLCFKPDK